MKSRSRPTTSLPHRWQALGLHEYRLRHAIEVLEHFVGPNAQDAIALALEPIRAARIVSDLCRLGVLAPIDLDDEPFLEANEIGDVRTDRMLAPEAQAVELTPAQG